MGYTLFVMWDYSRNVLSGQRSYVIGKQAFGDRFVWEYTKGGIESIAASFLWGSRCDLRGKLDLL